MSVNAELRPTETRRLHFSLSHAADGDDLTFHVAMRSHPIRRHDAESRKLARETHKFLRGVPDSYLTHFIDVPLPEDAIAMMEVTKKIVVDGEEVERTVHLGIHVPSRGHEALRRRLLSGNEPTWDVHPKLEVLRELGANDGSVDAVYPEGIYNWQAPKDTAAALIYKHPDLLNLNAEKPDIPAHILEKCIMEALRLDANALPRAIAEAGDDWMTEESVKGPDGKVVVDPATGKPLKFKALDPEVESALKGPVAIAVRLAKDDTFLRNIQWNVQHGLTADAYHATTTNKGGTSLRASRAPRLGDGPVRWSLKNLTPGCGLEIDSNLVFTGPPQQQTFTVNDMWMSTDKTDPLDDAAVAQLLAGKVFVKLIDAAHLGGAARAQLVPEGTPAADKPVTFKAEFTGTPKVTGTFKLNDLRTALTFNLTVTGLGGGPSGTFGFGGAGEAGRDVHPFRIDDAGNNGTLKMEVTNKWLRHLSACVQFRNDKGDVIVPANWSHKMPSGLRPVFEPDSKTKFVSVVPPVRTVFGIPVPPDPTSIEIPVPPEASKIVVYYGGLGYGGSYDVNVCPIGVALTVTAEMAIPVILLLAGTAVTNSKAVVALMADGEVLFAVCTVVGFLVAGGSATYILTSQDAVRAVKDVAITLGPMLLTPATALGRWLIKKAGEGVAQRAVPFLNVAAMVINGAATAAQLSQTIVEVLESPWKYQVEITRAIDISVTMTADERSHVFPDLAVRYVVSVVYDSGATIPSQEFKLVWARTEKDITVRFYDAPAGGRVKVYAFFYAANGWQAGQGESPWFDAKGTNGSTLEIKDLKITTNDVPLTSSSVYTHKAKLAYDAEHGHGHYWKPETTPPDRTRTSPSPYEGKVIQRLLSITTAQRPGMMAYAWEASGLNVPEDVATGPRSDKPMYTVQNLSSLQEPESGYAVPPVGFSTPPGVLYDVTSPDDGSGRNFFVDSSRGEYKPNVEGSGLHLRRVVLKYKGGAPDYSTRTNKSWGRFPVAVDRYILHPQGIVIGISYKFHKIYLLTLPAAAVEDKDASLAVMASGQGFREGLVNGPSAIATGLDGRVLILESGNKRIQAFDIFGNPVPYFGEKSDQPFVQLIEPDKSKYLDLAVEAKGYLYVLRYREDGAKPENYCVDLYEPSGKFLVTTPKFAADKLTVDLMRNLFALNYEVLQGKDKRTEPGVSMWIPPAPPK